MNFNLGHILIAGSITFATINFVHLFSNVFLQMAGLLAAAICLYYLVVDYQDKKSAQENVKLYAAYISFMNFIWVLHVIYIVIGFFVK